MLGEIWSGVQDVVKKKKTEDVVVETSSDQLSADGS